jgi:hypothetical protein
MLTSGKTIQFSFLTSGPKFSVQIPVDFVEIPILSSPLVNGVGGRSFDYAPQSLDPGIDEAIEFVRSLSDPEGRKVELFWRLEPPPMWWLRWTLSNGALYSHLREEDGDEMADATVANLAIVEDPQTGAPFLIPSEPLRFVSSTAPTYQERAAFMTGQHRDWNIVLQRPGFIREGSVYSAPAIVAGGAPVLRAGLRYGLEAQVWAGQDLTSCQEMLATIADSLSET